MLIRPWELLGNRKHSKMIRTVILLGADLHLLFNLEVGYKVCNGLVDILSDVHDAELPDRHENASLANVRRIMINN